VYSLPTRHSKEAGKVRLSLESREERAQPVWGPSASSMRATSIVTWRSFESTTGTFVEGGAFHLEHYLRPLRAFGFDLSLGDVAVEPVVDRLGDQHSLWFSAVWFYARSVGEA